MNLITGPPQSPTIEKRWLIVYQTTLTLLWLLLPLAMMTSLVVNRTYHGPTVVITARDTSQRVMEIPVRRWWW